MKINFMGMLIRLLRAARLDGKVYQEVRQDQTLTMEALIAVGLISVVGGFGSALLAVIRGAGAGWFFRNFFLGLLCYLIAWILFYVGVYVAAIALGLKADPQEMMRVLAYAYAPALLWFLILIDVQAIQIILVILICLWLAATAFFAVQQLFPTDIGRMLIIVAAGVIPMIMFTIFGGGGMWVTGTWATDHWWDYYLRIYP